MANDRKKYDLLIIEDNPGDFALVEDLLFEQIETPAIKHVKTYREAKELLTDTHDFDVILLDLSLPDKTGEPLIKEIIELAPNIPVIIFTGYSDLDFGIHSLSLGVADYILKDELTAMALYKSIVYSLERKKAITALSAHIKAIEEQNAKMKEISWLQSHIIRAPLARMMGLMYLVKLDCDDMEQIIDYLFLSAQELDGVIKDITEKSKAVNIN